MGTDIHHGRLVIRYSKEKRGEPQVLGAARETRTFGGRTFLLEEAIRGDVALVKGWRADRAGNVVFRKAARNFNPAMAKAAQRTIVEVEEVVEEGVLLPDDVHLPGIYVDAVVVGDVYERRMEKVRCVAVCMQCADHAQPAWGVRCAGRGFGAREDHSAGGARVSGRDVRQPGHWDPDACEQPRAERDDCAPAE